MMAFRPFHLLIFFVPGWIIELFGSKQLTQAFWLTCAVTLPFWLGMLLLPQQRWVRRICSPWGGPILGIGLLFYFYFLLVTLGAPALPEGVAFSESKAVAEHPLVFLVIWCQINVLHLLLGTFIFREANRNQMRVPVELILCWLLGPIGWFVFTLRLGARKALKE